MNERVPVVLIVIGIIMLISSIIPLILLIKDNDFHGRIEPNWANPTGIQISDIPDGTVAEFEYSATEKVYIYLLSREQALNYRSPEYYKEPLPDPIDINNSGKVSLSFTKGGDYEILVLPFDGTFDFECSYTIRGIEMDTSPLYFSCISTVVSGLLLIIFGITFRRMNQKIGHE